MSTVAAVPTAPAASEGTFLGHPKGLFVLFLTEMWERFSYYGMRSLLTLYMVNYLFIQPDVGRRVLGFDAVQHAFMSLLHQPFSAQPMGSWVYGLYTGFVYFTPFFGGLLADRILGQRRTVVVGAILMSIGHFMMASERMFFPALITLILGNGCFKPNISTQVGLLYPPGDKRRDSAFSIFYVGINVGAFLAPLICGTLGQKVGWHYGFGAAGVGMTIGLCIYLYATRTLPPDVKSRVDASGPQQPLSRDEWRTKELRSRAERNVKIGLALAELQKLEDIKLATDKLDKEWAKILGMYAKDAKSKEELDTPDMKRDFANRLATEQVIDRLVELNNPEN